MRGWWRRSPVAAPSSGAMSGDLAAAVTVRSFLTVRARFPVTGEVKQGLWGIFPACRECALWPYFRASERQIYKYHRRVTGKGTIRAGVYCRLSEARTGDTTKVDDQERICRDLGGKLGWPVAEVYVDNNRSAWQRNRKRKDWERMLADVDRGHINALLIYHGDRLIRQPFDLELLLNLAEDKGGRRSSPTGGRDLSNADDRFILRIEAAMACRESDNTSRRMKMGNQRRRRAGISNSGGQGGRLFGFRTDGIAQVPHEIAIVR